MIFRKELRTTVISLGVCLLASQAHAIAISDATIRNSAGGLDSSSAAVHGKGKIKNANINVFTGLFAGDAWTLLDRTNKPSKPFNDVNFLLAADTGKRSGNWGVSWDGFDFPAYMDYVLVLKSGKQWSAYLFESAGLLAGPRDVAGTYAISWLNKKGKVPKLRHASIFGRIGSAPTDAGNAAGVPEAQISIAGVQTGSLPVISESRAGIPGDRTGTLGDQTATFGDLTGTSGGQAGNSGSQAGTFLELDPNSVPIPGTFVLLAMGMGLGLRQLRQKA